MAQFHRLARKFVTVRREQNLRWLLSRFVMVRYRSPVQNVYHCCVWKTASQWIRNILSSMDVYRYSGLLPYGHEAQEGRDYRSLQQRTFAHAFPRGRIVTPLYINYESFAGLPKPKVYRAFFVVRDPRDLVVSHYFSSRFSHTENPGVLEDRARLIDLSENEGIIAVMRLMAQRGIFSALQSWLEHSCVDARARVFRFEDLVGADQYHWMTQLATHCDIRIPQENFEAILNRLSFERLSGGRKPGEEDKHHKYRSGKHGDWRKYFDATVQKVFDEVAGNLPSELGYD